jgi:hypothetical protein
MQGNAQNVWDTDGLIDRLVTLYTGGQFDCRSIANTLSAEFGVTVTKNAVIGKSRRLELPLMTRPVIARGPTRKRIRSKPTPHSNYNFNPPPRTGISIYDLNNCTCRYPLEGAGPPFLFCGLFCDDDCPYCPEHCELTHTEARKKWA